MGGIRQRRSFRRSWRALIADAAGLAAIEMALIFPMAVMLMSLIVYGGQAYFVWRKVTLGATTVANLLAQGNNNGSATITAAELSQILEYPSLILYPYNGSTVAVEGSQLLVTLHSNGTATGTVCESWADANGTPRPVGQQLSVDASIASAFSGSSANNNSVCGNIPANSVPRNYLILGEVQYPFQPTGIYFAVASITLSDSIMMIPRAAAQICVVVSGETCPQ
jgi:Flp pilus assembly protein TadG